MSEQITNQTPARDQSAVKLVFEQRNDRWAQQWFLITDQGRNVFLTSAEGTPDQNWPPSPPLQEVSRHELATGDAVLCVGMAGKSHWSASYSVESSTQPSQPIQINADLACLQKGASSVPVEMLAIGSTFELDAACTVVASTEGRIEVSLNADQIVLTAFSGEGCETVFGLTDHTLRVRPRHVSNSPVVATRWGFVVEAAS